MRAEAALPRREIGLQELSRVLNLSIRTVQQHAAAGHIPRLAPGRFIFPDAVAAFTQHLRAAADRNADTSGLADARQRLAEQRAVEITNRIAAVRSEYVSREDAAAGWGRVDAIVAARFAQAADRIAAEMPRLTPHDRDLIAAELRDAVSNARAEAAALGVIGAAA